MVSFLWSLFFFYPDSPPWLYPNYLRGSLGGSGKEDRCDAHQLFRSAWKNI
ncbi:hypothetical protein J2S21_003475 [Peribacillus cavernae]|nr:hypothetical protein [Peribacillus cavernae]